MKRFLKLLAELKRRRVYQVATAYAVASFAVLEAADLVLPVMPLPAWTYKALVLLVLAGLPVALALSWAFDITPEGIRREGGPSSVPEHHSEIDWKGRPLLVGTLVVGLVGVGAWFAGRRSAPSWNVETDGTIAVFPFSPAVPDTLLKRTGRELAITLSSSLAGTADLAMVEPLAVLARLPQDEGPWALADARETAADLGAALFLHGAILGGAEGYRLEMGLYQTGNLQRAGNLDVRARDRDALTDSATLAVLQLIWEETPSAPPSPGAISTSSLDALEAYLAGEQAIADGRWREAPEHFSSAIAADSTFWFAYWRLQYSLSYHGSPVDSLVAARAWTHRQVFPERDRLLLEAWAAPGSAGLETLREVTTRYPSYWPAWWDLADVLIHNGGYLGYTLADSRAALERTLALNPRMVSAWTHLTWVAAKLRDAEALEEIVHELSDVKYDQVSLQEAGINSLNYYRALLALAKAGGEPAPEVIDLGVRELAGYRGPDSPASVAYGLMNMGFLEAQIALSRGVLDSEEASPSMARAQHLILAHALAARGDWESALASADAFETSATVPVDLLLPYEIASVGFWAGGLDQEDAHSRRPSESRLATMEKDMVAETNWLDGLVAFVAGDAGRLARARADLAESGGRWALPLLRSLDALQLALNEDIAAAARDLADLETEMAEEGFKRTVGMVHPYLAGVDRVNGARWLLATGDTLSARKLLPWYEAVLPDTEFRASLANQLFAPASRELRRFLPEGEDASRQAP